MQSPSPRSRLSNWAQLVRLPTVFTVIADVSAAFLLVAGGPHPVWPLLMVVLAGISLYWAGMIFNDVFDAQRDQIERPTRPIPAGQISAGAARRAGTTLLLLGIALAATCGYVPTAGGRWLPGAVALILAVTVLLYDGPLKSTPLAPLAMGGCRFLSFTLGGSAALNTASPPLLPGYLLGIAAGFGVYIVGVTTMARDEATGGRSMRLGTGLMISIAGLVCLAIAPAFAGQAGTWRTDVDRTFPMLIGLIGLPVILRAVMAIMAPIPSHIQNTIRVGVLSIIPLSAAVAFLGAGPLWGAAVFALGIPAIGLGRRMRVT